MDKTSYQIHGKDMVDYIANYLETIRERKVFPNVLPGYMRSILPSEAPVHGEEWWKIMSDVEKVIMPGITHWQSPHMHAYYPAIHSYPSLLGDMLADGINAIGFTWASSPACTELEVIVMDWLGKMIGLPPQFLHSNSQTSGGGVIQTTCSEATFVSLLAARTEAIKKLRGLEGTRDSSDAILTSRLVAYCSEQAHSSVEKAALIGLVRLRLLPTDEHFRLTGKTLEEAIEQDKQNDSIPFFVCATLGTTGCCAFDELETIGPICEKEGIWLHIDAAYAGSSFICPEFRHFLRGIESAQSFVFNPSKWLLVHFDCTAMWVRNSGSLHCTFNVDPLYLQHENSGHAIDYMHWQVPLSRRFRSLKLWFVLRSYGVIGLQNHIRQSIQLGAHFESLVMRDERFEIPAKRHLGLIVFRLRGKKKKTETLLKMLNRSGDIHMVPASLNGTYVIRFTVTSPKTTIRDIERDWQLIQNAATKLLEDENKFLSAKPMTVRSKMRRRYTWSHHGQELWDTSMLLSNVPDHPSIVNGTFAAIYDWKDLTSTGSNVTEGLETLDGEQDNPPDINITRNIDSRPQPVRGCSVDTDVQTNVTGLPEFLTKSQLQYAEQVSIRLENYKTNFNWILLTASYISFGDEITLAQTSYSQVEYLVDKMGLNLALPNVTTSLNGNNYKKDHKNGGNKARSPGILVKVPAVNESPEQ